MKYLVTIGLLIGIIYILINGYHHETTVGEHTGYVTAIERSGLYFKTIRAYVKTDPQSSQEDEYCVVDPEVYSKLEEMSRKKTQITISFLSWIVSGWKNCSGEDAVIYNVIATADIPLREEEARIYIESYVANDPARQKQIIDMKKAMFDITGKEADFSEIKELLDYVNATTTNK